MKTYQILLVFLACGFFVTAESYRILGIFPFCSRSHQMLFDALSKGLAKRGHQVDIVTCFPPDKSMDNFKVLMNTSDSQPRLVNNLSFDAALNIDVDVLKGIAESLGNELCKLMGREELQRIIKNPPKDPPYDLVIMESFGANCFLGLGESFNIPVILVSSNVMFPWMNRAIGNPSNLAFFPSFFTSYSHPLTFWERVSNTIQDAIITYRYNEMTGDIQTELMRKYLGPEIPHIRELEKKVTLIMINSHYTQTGVRPMTTGLIEIGGLHVDENYVELPKDLKKWMDDSTDGVIYFTLGSMVNIETLANETIKSLYDSFEKIAPVRVLMKVTNKNKLLPGQPKNLLTAAWIPQIAVLAHKNTRVFITHCGLLSTTEALYYGVPIVGIPLFGDQYLNVKYYERMGMMVTLDYKNINEQEMSAALDKLLNDPKYRNAAKLQSARFHDRPMSPMDTAIFWVEYTIRNGPDIIKSPMADLTRWQNELLDVYAFLITSVIIAICALLFIIKLLVKKTARIIWPHGNSSDATKNRAKHE